MISLLSFKGGYERKILDKQTIYALVKSVNNIFF